MACIVTVSQTLWLDEIYLKCPGASQGGAEQALHHALREFCKQSGAWIVELWQDDGTGLPIPFNEPPSTPYYDFQAMLEAERATQLVPVALTQEQIDAQTAAQTLGADSYDLSWNIIGDEPCYPTCDPATPWLSQPPIEAYWAWDILYFKTVAYFDEYIHASDPTDKTMQATRFLGPSQTQNFRGFHGSTPDVGPRQFMTYNERPGAMQVYPSLNPNLSQSGIVPWVSLGFPAYKVCEAIPVVFERYWYEHILDGAVSRLMSQQDKPYTNPQLAVYHAKRFRNGISEARDMAQRQFNTTERGWAFPRWA